MRNGQPAQISDFRENDRLTATIITTMPPKVMTEKEVKATLARSSAAAAARRRRPARAPRPQPPDGSTGRRRQQPPPPSTAAATSGAAPRKLPKTASPLPLLGLTGLASLLAGLGLTVRRRRATH